MEAGGEARLPIVQKLSYGVGHVLNDLCASMWFSYLLVFYHYVIKFNNEMAGYLLLLGQVADAVVTPFIGVETDRSRGICGYGKRKSWHLVGCICVGLSFPFLFNKCIGCTLCDSEKPTVFSQSCWVQFAYYAPFIVIFQFGWAATQVSHLSLIPELTSSNAIKVELNAMRYAFTVISNIVVYLIAWILLRSHLTNDSPADPNTPAVGPDDAPVFRTLSLSVAGIGAVFCVLFHVGTPEKRGNVQVESACNDFHTTSNIHSRNEGMTWKDWFKEIQFYQVGMIYMCTRLIVNLSQIYMPMYLTDTLHLEQHYIAVIPLIVYVSGFFSSIMMGPINKCIGRKCTYSVGCVVVVGACIWLWFISKSQDTMQVIGAAIILGCGTSTILVTSLSMTADLIGNHKGSSAFVYGAMSFTDKLSNGLAVVAIQQLHPCKASACCSSCMWYYRDILVFVVGGLTVLVFLLLLTVSRSTIGNLKKYPIESHSENERLIPSGSRSSMSSLFFSGTLCQKVCICFRRPSAETVDSSGERD